MKTRCEIAGGILAGRRFQGKHKLVYQDNPNARTSAHAKSACQLAPRRTRLGSHISDNPNTKRVRPASTVLRLRIGQIRSGKHSFTAPARLTSGAMAHETDRRRVPALAKLLCVKQALARCALVPRAKMQHNTDQLTVRKSHALNEYH